MVEWEGKHEGKVVLELLPPRRVNEHVKDLLLCGLNVRVDEVRIVLKRVFGSRGGDDSTAFEGRSDSERVLLGE